MKISLKLAKKTGNSHTFHRWELRACARKGHLTYKPTGKADAHLQTRLHAKTELGDAWRCLRCGTFVLGVPKQSGPARKAPQALRGKALRQATILRFLAVERIIRGLVLLLVAYGIFKFRTEQTAFQSVLDKDLPALRALGANLNWDVDSSALLRGARKVIDLKQSTITLASIAVFIYAAIEIIEGVGLWLLKRWGEYFAVIATSAFIPLEIEELLKHITVFKAGALAINVAAVAYLLYSKRLFGLRGGGAAYEKELEGETLLQIKQASDE